MNDPEPRTAESLLLEADYWLTALRDLDDMNLAVGTLATKVVSFPIIALELLSAEDPRPAAERTIHETSAALDLIQTVQDSIRNLIELARGRGEAIRAEGGLDK